MTTKKQSTLTKPAITERLLQLLSAAHQYGAEKIWIDPGSSVVEMLRSGASAPQRLAFKDGELAELSMMLQERSFHWPALSSEDFEMPAQASRKVRATLGRDAFVEGEIQFQRKPGSSTFAAQLDRLSYHAQPLRASALVEDGHLQRLLTAIIARPTGLVITNCGSSPYSVDAAALILALRPDAVYYKRPTDTAATAEAAAAARERLVVVGLKGEDPLQLARNFLARLEGEAARREAAAQLLGALIHLRVRRSCGACARSTIIPSTTIEQLPLALRSIVSSSYRFGRGCPQCGHTAYKGTVALESGVQFTPRLRELLLEEDSAEDLAFEAYGMGTRCLLEDGLQKIAAGRTSFEEVLGQAPHAPAALLAASSRARAEAQRPPRSAAVSNGTRRMLIVEDDENQRQILVAVFEGEGYEVRAASNGKEALSVLEGSEADVILCDLMMPQCDGTEFLRTLRAHQRHQDTPVLILTAADDPEKEYQLLTLGAADYCRKNVQKKILLRRVARLLGNVPKQNPLEHMLREE